MRGFRDRDYVQTVEGFFFCVIGPVHPEDRVIAYLKYVPDPHGKWGRGETRFKRALPYYTMLDLLGTLKFLEQHPEYLYNSKVMNLRMSAVPLNRISVHLKPEEKLTELMRTGELDALQQKVVELVFLLSEESKVPVKFFGVTGSVLLNIHRDFSDIDLTVYGMQNSEAVKKTLTRIYEEEGFPIHRFDEERAKEWCLNKTEMYHLTYEAAARILKRKWGRALFRDTMFSLHPVKLDEEVSEKYGDRTFTPEGMIRVEATVSDASEADFLPSVCKVRDVKALEGKAVEDIKEVVSYEGLYGGIAGEGERITAYGKLERVNDRRSGDEYHRVLVGSQEAKGKDYVIPL